MAQRKCCDSPRGNHPHAADCINNPANQGAGTAQIMPGGGVRRSAPETADGEPDWTRKCSVCGAKPVVRPTGMCGPCTFGEAATAGGDW